MRRYGAGVKRASSETAPSTVATSPTVRRASDSLSSVPDPPDTMDPFAELVDSASTKKSACDETTCPKTSSPGRSTQQDTPAAAAVEQKTSVRAASRQKVKDAFTFDDDFETRAASSTSCSSASSIHTGAANPTPGASSSSGANTTANEDQLQYILDGLTSSVAKVKLSCAEQLVRTVQNPSTHAMLRLNGGLASVLSALTVASDGSSLQLALLTALHLCSQNPQNIPFFTGESALFLFRLAVSSSQTPLSSAPSDQAPLRRRRRAENDATDYTVMRQSMLSLFGTNLPGACTPSDFGPALLCCDILAAAASNQAFRRPLMQTLDQLHLLDRISDSLLYLQNAISNECDGRGDSLAFHQHRLSRLLELLEHLSDCSPLQQKDLLNLQTADTKKSTVEVLLALLRFFAQRIEAAQSKETDDQVPNSLVHLCLIACRILVNFTNKNELGCRQLNDLSGIKTIFDIFALVRQFCETAFDSVAACMGILINCAEQSEDSRHQIAAHIFVSKSGAIPVSSLEYVVQLFEQCASDYASAMANAQKTDQTEGVSEKALEHQVLAAYSALLIGCLSKHSTATRDCMEKQLKCGGFGDVIGVLQEFLVLQSDAQMLTQDNLHSVVEILAVLKNVEEERGRVVKDILSFSQSK